MKTALRSSLSLVFLLIQLLPFASAEEVGVSPDQMHPATLPALTRWALAHQPATRAAWSAAEADRAAIEIEAAALRPALSADVDGSLRRQDGDAAQPDQAADARSRTTRSASAGLSLEWLLFDFGSREHSVEAARYQALATRLARDRVLQATANAVEQAYFSLMAQRQSVAALRTSLASADRSAASAKALLKRGTGTRGDSAQSEAFAAAARLSALQAAAQERIAAAALNAAVGLPVQTVLDIGPMDAALDDETVSDPLQAEKVESLLARARAMRPDLEAARADVAQARQTLEAARRSGLPTLALAASTAHTFTSPGADPTASGLTLNLHIPVFDGGLVRANVAAAKARLDQRQAELDGDELNADYEVWQRYQQAAITGDSLRAAKVGLESADVAEMAARQLYEAGVSTLLQVLVAQTATAQARLNLVQARYDGLTAFSNLAYAIGRAPGLLETTP